MIKGPAKENRVCQSLKFKKENQTGQFLKKSCKDWQNQKISNTKIESRHDYHCHTEVEEYIRPSMRGEYQHVSGLWISSIIVS